MAGANVVTSWQGRMVVGAARLVRVNRLWAGELLANCATRRAANLARRPAAPDAGRPPAWAVRGLRVDCDRHADWPVWTLTAPGPRLPERVVVFVHGGAYIQQIRGLHYRWCADIVRRTGATVVVPIYPLAPIGTSATVVPTTADLINMVIAEHGRSAVTLAGDSAGGGLALAAAQEVIRRGGLAPARMVLISPWLDLTVSDPASDSIADPLLAPMGLRACGRLWAGDLAPSDPRVSPLFGSLAGLPPTTVYTGSLDVLHPDALRLRDRAREQGAGVDVVVRAGLPHVWPLMGFLPETRDLAQHVRRAVIGDPV